MPAQESWVSPYFLSSQGEAEGCTRLAGRENVKQTDYDLGA